MTLTLLGLLERRLQRSDMVQIFTLSFAALIFVVTTRWPVPEATANEAWFALAQSRLVVLGLLALGFGSAYARRPGQHQAVTGLAIVVFALLTIPLDVATFAASMPAVPLWWTLVLPLVDTIALFGIGLLLGRLMGALRLTALLPVAVPALLIGFVALDVQLGLNVLNPLTASVNYAPAHLAAMAVTAAATAGYLLRVYPQDRE